MNHKNDTSGLVVVRDISLSSELLFFQPSRHLYQTHHFYHGETRFVVPLRGEVPDRREGTGIREIRFVGDARSVSG